MKHLIRRHPIDYAAHWGQGGTSLEADTPASTASQHTQSGESTQGQQQTLHEMNARKEGYK